MRAKALSKSDHGRLRPLETKRDHAYIRLVSDNTRRVGTYLAYLREKAGLTQSAAARKAGMKNGSGYWSDIESGFQTRKGKKVKVKPSPEKLDLMARAVDADPQETIELFELAGYGSLIKSLRDIVRQAEDEAALSEEAIARDRTLTDEERQNGVDYIQWLRSKRGMPKPRRVTDEEARLMHNEPPAAEEGV